MDELLANLSDVSRTLIPIAGLVCLILLALILYRVFKVVKAIPVTVTKVDNILDATHTSIDQLQAPLATINNVSKTIDTVNNVTATATSSIVSWGFKNFDVIQAWLKDFLDKDKKETTGTAGDEKKEEDFGIYE